MKKDLTDADFSMGSPEAWDPIERDKLEHRFLPISQYTHIADNEKIFLCGRRGSGKSTIALMLEKVKNYKYTEAVQGEVVEYGSYMDVVREVCRKQQEGKDIDVKKSIRRLWMWVLPVKVMQTVLKQTIERGDSLDKDLETIKQYLNSLPEPLHEESSIGHLLTNIFHIANEKLDEGEEIYNTYLLNLSHDKGYRAALNALHRRTHQNPVLLILDTLESYRIFETPMIEGLKGILEAINALRGERKLEFISLKFFMPAEIYDTVFLGFPGKVQSSAVFLRWSSPNLITMLARRYLDILVRTEAISNDEVVRLEQEVKQAYLHNDGRHLRGQFWYSTRFLPETLPNKMGRPEDCFAYMFRHTQRRPRDVLAQMQAIITEARKRNEFPYISKDSVAAGVHNPQALLQILGDALTPYEGSLPIQLVDGARSVFYKRPRIMAGSELKQFAKELYNLHPIANVDLDEFVSALVKCGVIGLLGERIRQGQEKGQQDKTSSPYRKAQFEYVRQGNLVVAARSDYCVHPVMGDAFNMLSPNDGLAIYPYPDEQEGTWLEEAAGIR